MNHHANQPCTLELFSRARHQTLARTERTDDEKDTAVSHHTLWVDRMHDGELLQVHVLLTDTLTAGNYAHATFRLREKSTSRRWSRYAWTVGVIRSWATHLHLSGA